MPTNTMVKDFILKKYFRMWVNCKNDMRPMTAELAINIIKNKSSMKKIPYFIINDAVRSKKIGSFHDFYLFTEKEITNIVIRRCEKYYNSMGIIT
tara:strand:+ start:5425 stop:5709 length:285 start_codon:yes stop_codon:yes gene_type:complete